MVSRPKILLRKWLGDETYAGLKVLLGKEIFQGVEIKCRTEMHGTKYGGWSIIPEGITAASVVYSFGIGNDLSFDLSLIQKYGVTVHAFDPTPDSIAWTRNENLPSNVMIHEYGVWCYDGVVDYFAPKNSSSMSHTILGQTRDEFADCQMKVQVKTVSTIMREIGHSKIDILKMDIEGAEYEVINEIIDKSIPVRQLLVEFHHFFSNISVKKTRKTLEKLKKAGYKVFYVDPGRKEFSFFNKEPKVMS